MIVARIISEWEDGDSSDRTIYEVEVDSNYNPDILEDMIKRVTIAAKEDRDAKHILYRSEDATED